MRLKVRFILKQTSPAMNLENKTNDVLPNIMVGIGIGWTFSFQKGEIGKKGYDRS